MLTLGGEAGFFPAKVLAPRHFTCRGPCGTPAPDKLDAVSPAVTTFAKLVAVPSASTNVVLTSLREHIRPVTSGLEWGVVLAMSNGFFGRKLVALGKRHETMRGFLDLKCLLATRESRPSPPAFYGPYSDAKQLGCLGVPHFSDVGV